MVHYYYYYYYYNYFLQCTLYNTIYSMVWSIFLTMANRYEELLFSPHPGERLTRLAELLEYRHAEPNKQEVQVEDAAQHLAQVDGNLAPIDHSTSATRGTRKCI